MIVEIDQRSGFCFGVVHAIDAAERELRESGKLYCLGDIVHNSLEVERLNTMGLEVIDHEQLKGIRDSKVMIRAHGEPPETYAMAKENGITLTDASCPIVLNLQGRIRRGFEEMEQVNGQIVILGKEGHAEVIGLKGQAMGRATVIAGIADLDLVDFTRPSRLYSQTTKSPDEFSMVRAEMERRYREFSANPDGIDFKAYDTICRQVSNRAPELKEFARRFDVIIFVSDPKSSNGKYLYSVCLENNPNTYFVSGVGEVKPEWLDGKGSVGICGATSTPHWAMEKVKEKILRLNP